MAFCGLIVIVVANQADTEGDIIEVVAMHMAAVDLALPAIANFNFAITRGGAIAYDKLVSEAIGHFTDMQMVILEGLGVALACAAVMDDDIPPPVPQDRGVVNLFANAF